MQNDLKLKLASIRKALFLQETKLRDAEQSSRELNARLADMRQNVS